MCWGAKGQQGEQYNCHPAKGSSHAIFDQLCKKIIFVDPKLPISNIARKVSINNILGGERQKFLLKKSPLAEFSYPEPFS